MGVEATVFMPQDAPMAKVEPTRSYGGAASSWGARCSTTRSPTALAHVEETGATFVHPFEDERVIAGQGTIGLELAEQVPDAGTVVIPVGGGGLAAGISLALRAVGRTCGSSASRRGSRRLRRSPTGSRSSSPAS